MSMALVKPVRRGFGAGFAGELEPVGVVDEAVQDGVDISVVGDHLVPARHRHLRGDGRRAEGIALFEDF